MSTPDNRSVNFFSLFRRGQHYSKTWPLEKRLAPVFVENRVIKMTRYAIRFMPPIAVFTLCWQIALGGQLGPAVATALFALSLPMQGLWWLGKRSVTPLPLLSSTGFMKFAVNCRSLDRCWHPLKASLITRH
ncbi:inner membrane protein [Escherichia coli]|uniref:UPF0208 membrane protein YfbV n=1 Tax=Shigella dysenteriae TaxID=622 RepID=A0A3P6LRC0_SHIDY|nr:inner membrane protein [Escherichia coli]VDG93217.1 membrane protein yfbV [Shigella dysenteriae]